MSYVSYTIKAELIFQDYMNLAIKLFFLILALGGVVLVFYVSWFWRALIVPMVIIILIDVFADLFRKRKK